MAVRWRREVVVIDPLPWLWYSIDMQLAYNFRDKYGPWLNGVRVAVGVNNITDNEPPLIASAFEDNTDKATYDIIGRSYYIGLTKRF